MPEKHDAIFGMRRKGPPVQPSLLPRPAIEGACLELVEGRPVEIGGKVEPLTEALFSLEEPWQSRFLNLVANLATKWSWNRQRPTPEEIAGWLSVDPELYQHVKLLLDT
ncbi:MAG: hypothetical protein JSW37_14140, partial [Anaerolineales bacterium]